MNAHLLVNRGEPLRLKVGASLDLVADRGDRRFQSGENYTFELASMAFPIDVPITDQRQMVRYVSYLRAPPGLRVLRGTRRDSPGFVDLAADDGAVELSAPKAEGVEGMTLPVRVNGLNPRWSAGLLQEDGYSAGAYGTGRDRFRALGIDFDGAAYVPMYVDRAELTRMLAGHPIVADTRGRALFIQVTCLGGTPFHWHVSINNPEDHPITTVLKQAMSLPGLGFSERQITIGAGEYVVLQ
jgi:hypothetical protein